MLSSASAVAVNGCLLGSRRVIVTFVESSLARIFSQNGLTVHFQA